MRTNLLRRVLPILICVQLVACQQVSDPVVAKYVGEMGRDKKLSAGNQAEARLLAKLYDETRAALENFPQLADAPKDASRAVSIYASNDIKVTLFQRRLKQSMGKLVDEVKNLSSLKYAPGAAVTAMGESETLTLLSLLSVRQFARVGAALTLNIMGKVGDGVYETVPGAMSAREELMKDYLALLATASVAGNDLKTTMDGLADMRRRGLLSSSIEKRVNQLVSTIGARDKTENKKLRNQVRSEVKGQARNDLEKAVAKQHEMLVGKTLLFDPAHPDQPALAVLVIASNLSWGLINSLVGLCAVVIAVVAAPTSQIVASVIRAFGFQPAFTPMDFPSIHLSENGMQIFADVCGLTPVAGEMSAGLFELANCTGSFAPGHEGGHAKQSALLGPFYFPAAMLSYIMYGFDQGFIEDWADAWRVT